MTAVFNIIIPVLAGFSVLAALVFIARALQARAQSSREVYGVGQQVSRQAMQVDLIRSVAALFVGLILFGVFGLSLQPAAVAPTATTLPTKVPITATATATISLPTTTAEPIYSPTAEPSPTSPLPTATPSPMPTDTPTPEPATAVVSTDAGVWLRTAPGLQTEQSEWLLNGTVLIVLPGRESADDFDWQQVRAPSGNEGWVAVDFIVYNE